MNEPTKADWWLITKAMYRCEVYGDLTVTTYSPVSDEWDVKLMDAEAVKNWSIEMEYLYGGESEYFD